MGAIVSLARTALGLSPDLQQHVTVMACALRVVFSCSVSLGCSMEMADFAFSYSAARTCLRRCLWGFEAGAHIDKLGWLAAFEQETDHGITSCLPHMFSHFPFLLGWKAGIVQNPDARRRLRLLVQGCSVSLTPLLPVVLSHRGMIPVMPVWPNPQQGAAD